jgi:two-component system, sensor histidine kinase and response regulator
MPDQLVPKELLEWENEILISITQSNSSCIAIFNVDGNLIFANETMRALFSGIPSDSFLNPTFDKLLSLDNSANDSLFSGYITMGSRNEIGSSIFAHAYRKKDKILIVGGVNAKSLLEHNQAMLLLNRQVNDLQRQLIREKHELEVTLKKLNEANEQLKILNATKDKLFSIIAHDLRNPFGSVYGLSSLLVEKIKVYPIDRLEVFANNIFNASKQAYNLLENLLEWSRIQTGNFKPKPNLFNIYDLIEDVLALCEPMANEKNILLSATRNEGLSVFADKEMISTVLRNLVTNAIKFTNSGGSVTISVDEKNVDIICSVSDTGIGMDQNFVENLFRIDTMASSEGTANERGTGLGLILCKEFVEMNMGKIWVESTQNQGSSFRFTLPTNK